MRSEIIISTYNAPKALRLCLWSLAGQRDDPDVVTVADDGSGPQTKAVIAQMSEALGREINHVWHEDDGFRKTVILNKAVSASTADHLIFTDGDCLLSPGFVGRHRAVARADRFASGSLIRLNVGATALVDASTVRSGRVFDRGWLRAQGTFDRATTWLKTMPLPFGAQQALDRLYPIRKTWMGSNASAMRAAVLAVNGFDETMAWGGEDKEFGVRLVNSGVKGLQLRFTSPVVHLDHARGYVDPEKVAEQRKMIAEARHTGKTWNSAGIKR